jgi:hypothetical protein
VHVLVHKRGGAVRFSGKLGAHKVSPSNSRDLQNWVHEAESVWGLDETIGVSRSWMNTPETLEKIAAMSLKAAEKKKILEASRELGAPDLSGEAGSAALTLAGLDGK